MTLFLDDVQIGYPFGVIPADYGVPERVEVIFTAQVETKVLAAAPFSAWRRLKNQRILLTGSLSKAALVEVAVAPMLDRSKAEEEIYTRVWIGYLSSSLSPQVLFDKSLRASVILEVDGSK